MYDIPEFEKEPSIGMYNKLAGVTFEGRQERVKTLKRGQRLFLKREKDNQHDKNAVAVTDAGGFQLGYIRAKVAEEFAPALDKGVEYTCTVTDITGGKEGESIGVNIYIENTKAARETDNKYNVVPIGTKRN